MRQTIMIIAHHIIFGTNSHWLPNDERGSGSECVRSEALQEFGPATREIARTSSVAKACERSFNDRTCADKERRKAMEAVLKYPPVHLTNEQIRQVGAGFAQAIQDSGYTVYACAVMSTHVHLVVERHQYEARTIMKHFKTRATQHLKWNTDNSVSGVSGGTRSPNSNRTCSPRSPSPWQHRGWVVFIDSQEQLQAAIAYVEKHNTPPQIWEFVRPIRASD